MSYSIISYLLISFLILFSCAKISYKFQLVDLPSERKMHSNATAFTGGFAISVALIFSVLLFEIYNSNFNLIISMAFLMSMIGFIDDVLCIFLSFSLMLTFASVVQRYSSIHTHCILSIQNHSMAYQDV